MEKDLKEELMRVRAREKRYRNTAEAQIASLQAQLETMKEAMAWAETCWAELGEAWSNELEKENALLKEQLAELESQKNWNSAQTLFGASIESQIGKIFQNGFWEKR